ncbi:MAG: hypothetical protein LQ340_002407 [Diploschistes diacapsis]|nr:MAG: hypothetical protein LQ340_002407 [Diploschistes diacapsis]
MSFTALPVELKQMICDYVMVECGEVVHLDFAGVLPQEGSDVDEDLGASDGLSIIGEPYASSPADPPLCSTGIGLETPTKRLSIAARGNDNAQDKDKADRARAARRYRSRLALAEAYPPLAEYCRERFAENNVFTVGRATLISDLQKYTPQILSAYPAVQMIKTLTLHFGGKARALFKDREYANTYHHIPSLVRLFPSVQDLRLVFPDRRCLPANDGHLYGIALQMGRAIYTPLWPFPDGPMPQSRILGWENIRKFRCHNKSYDIEWMPVLDSSGSSGRTPVDIRLIAREQHRVLRKRYEEHGIQRRRQGQPAET